LKLEEGPTGVFMMRFAYSVYYILEPLGVSQASLPAKLLELTILSFRLSGEIFNSTNKISTMKDSSLCSEWHMESFRR